MFSVRACTLPEKALLQKYNVESEKKASAGYADCYSIVANRAVSLSDLVFAFYTTPLFKIERTILQHAVAKPSNDDQARQLADGEGDTFSAWTVEDRAEDQILLRDYLGRTRSWLMVAPDRKRPDPSTTLFFGSAVVPRTNPDTGAQDVPAIFNFTMGFHDLYSRALLQAARSRLDGLAA
jgi:hypothetical protein